MPTYEFRCPDGHLFDKFYRTISAAEMVVPCPTCAKPAERQISGGAGLQFKGSGFYLTDYGKNAHRGGAAPSNGDGKGEGKGKGESKGGESAAPSSGSGTPAGSSGGSDKPASGGSSAGSSGGSSSGGSSGGSGGGSGGNAGGST